MGKSPQGVGVGGNGGAATPYLVFKIRDFEGLFQFWVQKI